MKEQYKKQSLVILLITAVVVNFILADLLLLPNKTVSDKITSATEIARKNRHFKAKFGTNKQILGYKYQTEHGFEFTTEDPIAEKEIRLKHTPILKNVTGIASSAKDYTSTLISDLNHLNFYFFTVLSISAVLSIILFRIHKNMSDGVFQNIVIFNSLMIFMIAMIQYCIY